MNKVLYCILPLCTLVNRNPRMNRKTDSSSRQNNKMKTVFGNCIVKCVGITSYGQFHYHLNFFCERRRVGTDGPFLDAIWYVIYFHPRYLSEAYSIRFKKIILVNSEIIIHQDLSSLLNIIYAHIQK